MDKILFITACVRPCSRTRQLAESVLKKLDGPVEEVCLDGTTLSALGPEGIEKREQASQNGDFSDPEFDLAKQFASADHIVVAAPYWDLMFPGVLKLYLENITVAGITFRYIDRGIPIMVDWVDWAGLWQVLIGIDTCGTDTPYDDVLIFADPYDVTDHKQDGYYTYPLGRFFGMWREGPCAGKAEPYQQPFVAAWPKAQN